MLHILLRLIGRDPVKREIDRLNIRRRILA